MRLSRTFASRRQLAESLLPSNEYVVEFLEFANATMAEATRHARQMGDRPPGR